MYGRQNNSICPHESVQSNESFCECDDSLEVVQRNCNGRQFCAFEASNNVFSGDPCPNTYKYLEIKYTCINGTYAAHYRKLYFVLFRHSNLSIIIGKVHSNFWLHVEFQVNENMKHVVTTTDIGGNVLQKMSENKRVLWVLFIL